MPSDDYNLGFEHGEEDRVNSRDRRDISGKPEDYKLGYEHGYTGTSLNENIQCIILNADGEYQEAELIECEPSDFIEAVEIGAFSDIDESGFDKGLLGQICKERELGTIMNVPEVKIVSVMRKIGPIKTKIPKVMRRTKSIRAYSKICYPSGFSSEVEKEVMDCFLSASAAAAATALASGGTAALPVFWAAFKGCLIAKLPQVDEVIKGNIFTKTTHSSWKGV